MTQRVRLLSAPEDIWRSFLDFTRQRGFQYAIYYDIPAPSERIVDNVIFKSPPAGWFEFYVRNDCLVHDPVVLHLQRSIIPYTLEDVRAYPGYTAESHRVLDARREFGIRATFTIPLRSPTNGTAIISLGGADPLELDHSDRADLHVTAAYIDMCLRPTLRRGVLLPRLSSRECECLHWVAAGKTDHAIAEILKISAKTVNYHIETAKRKYGVASRTRAATMAVQAGILQI